MQWKQTWKKEIKTKTQKIQRSTRKEEHWRKSIAGTIKINQWKRGSHMKLMLSSKQHWRQHYRNTPSSHQTHSKTHCIWAVCICICICKLTCKQQVLVNIIMHLMLKMCLIHDVNCWWKCYWIIKFIPCSFVSDKDCEVTQIGACTDDKAFSMYHRINDHL